MILLIKETTTFRQKDLDNYLKQQKELLKKEYKLEGELKFTKKNLKVVKDEIKKNNNWLRNRE